MIARLPGHPRWRAKTRAGELLEASGLAEAAGRSGRTRPVCAGGWPGRDPELVFLDAASPCPPSRPPPVLLVRVPAVVFGQGRPPGVCQPGAGSVPGRARDRV